MPPAHLQDRSDDEGEAEPVVVQQEAAGDRARAPPRHHQAVQAAIAGAQKVTPRPVSLTSRPCDEQLARRGQQDLSVKEVLCEDAILVDQQRFFLGACSRAEAAGMSHFCMQ